MSKRRNNDNSNSDTDSYYHDTDNQKRLKNERKNYSNNNNNNEQNNKICCRFIIPSKFAGGLIGKKGSVINGLRDDYNVQVACPDSNGPERLFRIMGNDLDDVIDCVRDVAERLGPEMYQINKRLDKENGTEMRLLVNKGIAGGVIGAKGSRIKELRENTGCLINMHSECCPNSTDRILQVSGEIDSVIDCLRTVVEHIETLDPPNEQMKYDPNNWNDMIRYGGIKSDGSERDRGGRDRKRGMPPVYGGGHHPHPMGHYPGMYGPPMYPGPQGGAGGYPHYPPHPGHYGGPYGYYPPPNAYAPYSAYPNPPRNRNERKPGFGHGRSNR